MTETNYEYDTSLLSESVSSVSSEDFDIGVFNTGFEAYIDETLSSYEKNEQNKLDILNKTSTQDDILENDPLTTNLSNLPNQTIKAWNGVFNDITSKNISPNIMMKENRLFYITLTLFLICLIIYFLITIF
jgi:hypothetical protein